MTRPRKFKTLSCHMTFILFSLPFCSVAAETSLSCRAHLALSPAEAKKFKIQESYDLTNLFYEKRMTDMFLNTMRLTDILLIGLFIEDKSANWGQLISRSTLVLFQSLVTHQYQKKMHPFIYAIQGHADSACRFYGAKYAYSIVDSDIIREPVAELNSQVSIFLDGSEVQGFRSLDFVFRFDARSVRCKMGFRKEKKLSEFEVNPSPPCLH